MCLVVVYQAAARLGSVARWAMKAIKAVDSQLVIAKAELQDKEPTFMELAKKKQVRHIVLQDSPSVVQVIATFEKVGDTIDRQKKLFKL